MILSTHWAGSAAGHENHSKRESSPLQVEPIALRQFLTEFLLFRIVYSNIIYQIFTVLSIEFFI